MNKRLLIVSLAVAGIVATEVLIYNRMNALPGLPRCFPTGELIEYKDARGNLKFDSVYHTVPPFRLTDQNGTAITEKHVANKIVVANFFFCRCPTICPRMTKNLYGIQELFKNEERLVILSHTIDPEHDTVDALKDYAARNGVRSNWHLLTGSRWQLYQLSKSGYYLGMENDSPENFSHSDQFVLVDQQRIIRGFYKGTNEQDVEKLKKDAGMLIKELR